MGSDGWEQTIITVHVRAKQQPVFAVGQREKVAEFITRLLGRWSTAQRSDKAPRSPGWVCR